MLVSRTEALAHDLRRQDLLIWARHECVLLAHGCPAGDYPPLGASLRRLVGVTLIRSGERLRGQVIPVPVERATPSCS